MKIINMKQCKLLLAGLILLSITTNVFAQAGYEDVIYLKEGSIVHGVIIEQVPNETVKIQTKDRNIFVYKIEEILKITKEEIQEPRAGKERKESFRNESATNENIKKKGFTNITEINFAVDVGSDPAVDENASEGLKDLTRGLSFGAQTINGYQYNPYLSIGIGVGAQLHSILVLFPVFADVHVNFMAKRFTPFVSMAVGYSYTPQQIFGFRHLGSDHKGGLLISPAAGVKYFVKPKMALNLSLGLRYQEIKLHHDYDYYNGAYHEAHYSNEVLRLFNFRFGITF